jgi:predicted nucleic-acid-binding protein
MARGCCLRRDLLTTVVLVELAWVLRVAAKFDRSAIAAALESLCNAQGVSVEEEQRVRRAIARFKVGAADFSDCLILEAARDAGALPVSTFDERFAREPTFSSSRRPAPSLS